MCPIIVCTTSTFCCFTESVSTVQCVQSRRAIQQSGRIRGLALTIVCRNLQHLLSCSTQMLRKLNQVLLCAVRLRACPGTELTEASAGSLGSDLDQLSASELHVCAFVQSSLFCVQRRLRAIGVRRPHGTRQQLLNQLKKELSDLSDAGSTPTPLKGEF